MASTILSDNGVSSGSAGIKTTADSTGALALQTTTAGGTVTTAITIDTSQNTTLTGYLNAPNTFGFKNRIINGGMVIDQRNAGASFTANDGTYSADRFAYSMSVSSKGTGQNSTTAPTGFTNSILFTSSSAYTVGAAEHFSIIQKIEGLNISDLAWGTASAATVTLSFWVRSSLTGTFGGAISNSALNRSYPFTYTISSANTFEYKTITITGDTTGTWLTTNGIGMYVFWNLGAGATNSATAGAWTGTSNIFSATGATSVVGTNGATFYLTGAQLEKGSTATSFDYRPYGTELALCQRYYSKSYAQGTVPGSNAGSTNAWQGINGTDGNQIQGPKWPVTMRATPTGYVWSLAGTASSLSTTAEVNSNINNGSWNIYSPGDTGARAVVGTGGLTNGAAYVYHWAASAEL